MKNLKLQLLVILSIGITYSCVEEKNKIKIIDDDTFIADEENENLKLAVQKAQDSLYYFLDKLNMHSKDTNYWFSAKTKFENPEMVNHFWFETIEFKQNDSIIGILHNEPDWSKELKKGDTIRVHKNDIEDWYIENELENKIEGDFTEKILFTKKQ